MFLLPKYVGKVPKEVNKKQDGDKKITWTTYFAYKGHIKLFSSLQKNKKGF